MVKMLSLPQNKDLFLWRKEALLKHSKISAITAPDKYADN